MSYTDLTDSISYKKLIDWQTLDKFAQNDIAFYMSRGLVLYETFEDYRKLIDHSFEVNYDNDGDTNFSETMLTTDTYKFGSKCADLSNRNTVLLYRFRDRHCWEEGSISLWFRNVVKGGVLFQTFWGLKLSLTNDGYMKLQVTDAEGTVHSITGTTDRSDNDDWLNVVACWRCKGDGSDKLMLYINGEEECSSAIKRTIYMTDDNEDSSATIGCGINEVIWTGTVEGTSYPSEDNWTFNTNKTDGVEAEFVSYENGVITIDTVSSESLNYSAYYSRDDIDIDFDTGFVLEWKSRMIGISSGTWDYSGTFNIKIVDGTQGEHVTVKFHRGFVAITDGSDQKVLYHDSYNSFHTYRLEVEGTTWTFYIDGIKKLTGSVNTTTDGDLIRWGIRSSSYFGKVDIDYIRYYCGSVYSPYGYGCGGYIDDLAIWNRILVEGEIETIGSGSSIKDIALLGDKDIERLNWHKARNKVVVVQNTGATTSTYTTISGTEAYFTCGSYPVYILFLTSIKVGASTSIKLVVDGFDYNELTSLDWTDGYTQCTLHCTHCGGKGVVPVKVQWNTGGSSATITDGIIIIKEIK